MVDVTKPRCAECGRPYDMQQSQPVMDGDNRAMAWISGFSAVALVGLTVCIATCNVRNHAADSARVMGCESAVAANNGDVSTCSEPKAPQAPQCSGRQQSYSCCVEQEQASTLHCWR